MIASIKTRRVTLSELKPAPYNPRAGLGPGDPAYEALARSVEEFGMVEPVVWNRRTGHVVGGHQRLAVLTARGVESVDVVVVDLPLDREKALNLALNKVQGRWDESKLAALLDELLKSPGFDFGPSGFDPGEARDLVAEILHPPGAAEAFDTAAAMAAAVDGAAGTVTRPGDLIVLGRDPARSHRLLCGDCTDPAQVRRLMDGRRAALFATDPPYLVGYDGTNHPGANAGTRNKDWSETYGVTWDDAGANPDLYDRFVGVGIAEAVAENAAWYCWHASRRQAMLEAVWVKHGVLPHCQIVWVKNRPVMTRTWYLWRHEPCLMGWRRGKKPRRTSRDHESTVWCFDTLANGPERPDHPTPKPLELFEIPIRQHTTIGDVCYEPFAGSGTQIIAAERLQRRCFAAEISPAYCDVIVRRYIAFAGPGAVEPAVAARYGERVGRSAPRSVGPAQAMTPPPRGRGKAVRP